MNNDGLAAIIDTPEFDFGNPSSPSRRTSAHEQDIGDVLNTGKPIQFDAAGLDSQYYRSLNALKNFAKEMMGRGIDLTQTPNTQDPQSMEAHRLWQQALTQHEKNADRLSQAKENQDLLLQALIEGKGQFGKNFMGSENGELLDAKGVQRNFFNNKPSFIDEYNEVLKQPPKNEGDQQAMEEFYNEAIEDLQQRVRDGEIPQEAAVRWGSLLQRPKSFDPSERDAKLEVLGSQAKANNARAAKTYADMQLSRERLKQLRNSKDGAKKAKGLEKVFSIFPETLKIARFAIDPSIEDPSAKGSNLGAFLGLDNKVGVTMEGVRPKGKASDADQEYTFKTITHDENRKAAQFVRINEDTGEEEIYEVEFDHKDISPALRSLFTPKEYKEMIGDLSDAGVVNKDGTIPARKLVQYISGEETLADRFGSIDLSTFKENDINFMRTAELKDAFRKLLELNPNASREDLKDAMVEIRK